MARLYVIMTGLVAVVSPGRGGEGMLLVRKADGSGGIPRHDPRIRFKAGEVPEWRNLNRNVDIRFEFQGGEEFRVEEPRRFLNFREFPDSGSVTVNPGCIGERPTDECATFLAARVRMARGVVHPIDVISRGGAIRQVNLKPSQRILRLRRIDNGEEIDFPREGMGNSALLSAPVEAVTLDLGGEGIPLREATGQEFKDIGMEPPSESSFLVVVQNLPVEDPPDPPGHEHVDFHFSLHYNFLASELNRRVPIVRAHHEIVEKRRSGRGASESERDQLGFEFPPGTQCINPLMFSGT